MTVYFKTDMKDTIEERSKVFGRSQTEEVIFLVKKGLEFEELKAELLLSHGIPKDNLSED